MRNIFKVDAHILQSNGVYAQYSGYPKTFDSDNYDGDIDKARKRAEGDFSEVWGAFCKRDDRLIQTVILMDIFGNLIESKSSGNFPPDPEPEPEPEPTPEPEPEPEPEEP